MVVRDDPVRRLETLATPSMVVSRGMIVPGVGEAAD